MESLGLLITRLPEKNNLVILYIMAGLSLTFANHRF